MSAPNFPAIPSVSTLLRVLKTPAMKRFSQNFLLDTNLTDKFVKSAGQITGAHVIEIGPGPGSLTRSILKAGPKSLTVIEKDRRMIQFVEILRDVAPCPLKIIHADVLTMNHDDLLAEIKATEETMRNSTPPLNDPDTPTLPSPPPLKLISNLPFNISTPLFFDLLRDLSLKRGLFGGPFPVDMTLAFQAEVAYRLLAAPNSSERGRLSVTAQHYCDFAIRLLLPGRVFTPPPEVDAAVVHFTPRVPPAQPSFDILSNTARALFSGRRKQIHNNIRQVLGPNRFVLQFLVDLGIDPTRRAESLTGAEVAKIAVALEELGPTLTWPAADSRGLEKLPGLRALTDNDRILTIPDHRRRREETQPQ
eukprot:m.245239 g.245239  ORF g.245239 m.245239 type:complete len:363 (+) comp35995_c0_seq1:65-1153(+)